MAKKIILIVLGILFTSMIGFGIYWTATNWKSITHAVDGTHLYTQEDLDKAKQEGIEIGITSKEEYAKLIDSYKGTIAEQNTQINVLNNQIVALNDLKTQNEATINSLNKQKEENQTLIATLNTKIKNLNAQIEELKANSGSNEDEIEELESQIANLEAQIEDLTQSNNNLVSSADSLALENENLNNQIKEIQAEKISQETTIRDLEARIIELENSIAYYQEYIAGLESDTLVVATFEFDGSVYEIQTLVKGACANNVIPEDTDYITFNYWTVDGERVDVTTYELNQNTTFKANVSRKYDATFKVDNEVYKTQIVAENGFATIPTAPSKESYEFDGWSTDGINVVDISSYPITTNTTFVAVFTKLYTTTFKYENEVVDTQSVRYGESATAVTIEDTEYKAFNGWMAYGNIVDVESYKVYENVEFTANITYSYDVKFMSDGVEFGSDIVVSGGYVTMDSEPIKDNHTFIGWSIDGTNIVDLSTYKISSNTTFIAVFKTVTAGLYTTGTDEKIMTWDELIENDYLELSDDGTLSAGTYATSLAGDLELSNSVKKIGNNTFDQCTELTEVIIPTSVTTLGEYCFRGCTGISKIYLPSSITSGRYALQNCNPGIVVYTDAEKISFSDHLEGNFKRIYNSSFEDYENAKIIVSGGVTYLEDSKNDYFGFVKYNNTQTEISLDERISSIPYRAFAGKNITKVIIPASVTFIGNSSFKSCTLLEEVIFEDGSACDTISRSAFESCKALENITLPSNLQFIGMDAFRWCLSLKTIYIPQSVSSVGANGYSSGYIFDGVLPGLTVYSGLAEQPTGDSYVTSYYYVHNYHYAWYDEEFELWYTSDKTVETTVKYGYTVDQYLAEING